MFCWCNIRTNAISNYCAKLKEFLVSFPQHWSFSKVFQEVPKWCHNIPPTKRSSLMTFDQFHPQPQMYDHTMAFPWELTQIYYDEDVEGESSGGY